MFDYVGGKLKSIAKVLWVLELIATIIMWFSFVIAYGALGFLLGTVVGVVLLLSSYFCCAMAYAIGEITENTEKNKLACDSMIRQHNEAAQNIQGVCAKVKDLEELCEDLKKSIASQTNVSDVQEEKKPQNAKLTMNDVVEKITQYKELLRLGVITEERFEALKQELLSSL